MKNSSAESRRGTDKLKIAIQKNRRRLLPHWADEYSPLQLFPQPPQPHMQASVIIPAKNESENIINALDALRRQQDENGNPLPYDLYEILLLANNCDDDTFAIATAYQQQHPQLQLHIADIRLEKGKAHIGTVRRLLMDEACRRHGQNRNDGIIFSTDADTEVDKHWITNTFREMANGCDVVGGRILTRQVDSHSKLYYLQDTTYRYLSARLEAMVDPTDAIQNPHFQCYGASLAVRCSTYRKAGRLPVIPFLEDEAFGRALHRIDARVRKSPVVKVYTSSRLRGRVKAGLSAHLKSLGQMNKQHIAIYVEAAQTLLEKYRARQQLRECWKLKKENRLSTGCFSAVTNTIGISPQWLLAQMDIAVYFGEFWEKTEFKMYTGLWRKKQKWIPIDKAIEEMRKVVNK